MSSATIKLIMDMEDKVSPKMSGVKDTLDDMQSKVESMAPTFRAMATAGTAAFAAIAGGSLAAVNSYGEAERSQRQLENAVIGVSKGTKEQADAIASVSEALQEKAGIDGDALKMGAAQLSTFGLQSQSVLDLTKSLADLTVNQNGVNASSDQYVQSANTIAKALNGQFGVLEKSGIRFTEAQQNMILYGTESEKVAALQEGLAQNLRETTDTLDGVDVAMAKSQRQMGEISESIGAALAPAFMELTAAVVPVLTNITNWVSENPKLTATIIAVAAGAAALVAALGAIGLILPPVIAGFGIIATAIGLISLPVVAVIAVIGALGAAIFLLWKNWDQVVGWMGSVWKAMGDIVSAIGESIKGIWDSMVNYVKEKVKAIIDSVKDALDALAELPGVKSVVSVSKSVVGGISSLFRAEGGPVNAGTAYTVGERGPETFIPSSAGRIVSSSNSTGGGVNITITGNSFMGKEGVAEEIGNEIMKSLGLRSKLSY